MQTVEKSYMFTTEVNRSKFMTYILPLSEYEGLHARLKKENPKANHVVYTLQNMNVTLVLKSGLESDRK